MIQLIVCTILGAFFAYRIIRRTKSKGKKKSKKNRFDNHDRVSVFLGGVAGYLVGMILCLIFLMFLPNSEKKVEIKRTKLVALKGIDETSGSCFMLIGSNNTNRYYQYYYENAAGGRLFGKMLADGIPVYEEDRTDAFLIKTGNIQDFSDKINLWLIPEFLECIDEKKSEIHVPKGTIKIEYKLDL